MDKKAIAEIRKLMTMNNCRIDKIRGCYVDENREIVTELKETFLALEESTVEKYCEIFRKTLGGKIGRNLFNLEFPLAEEEAGGKQDLLYRVQQSGLDDSTLVRALFDRIIETAVFPDKYLILLAHGIYDIPGRTSDGIDMEDASDYVYDFILCSICPVILLKEGLCYDSEKMCFLDRRSDWAVQRPDAGFLFPAFDDRAANLYGALLYNRSKDNGRDEFIDAVFHTRPPMAVGVQKDTFREVLVDSLEDDCSLPLVQSVHRELREMAVTHKEAHIPEPLTVGAKEVGQILEASGVSAEKAAAFRVRYEQAFGADRPVPPQNLLNANQLEYKTPDVVVKVAPDRSDLVTMREIGGVKYLLIKADEGVELNGVAVR